MDSPSPRLSMMELQSLAEPMGFALVGVAAARPSEHGEHLREWLAAGQHGEMHYLANHIEERLDPAVLLPGAKSIICIADFHPRNKPGNLPRNIPGNIPSERPEIKGDSPASAPLGKVARYAWSDDYHKTIKKRLFALADALRERFPSEAFKCAVDTAPVLEREHASRAGLGWVGKHTLMIHREHGSYMLLGEIITTLEIETSDEAAYRGDLTQPTDHCGTCTRCIDACPTDCITPYQVDASQCIGYLTIEHRTAIDPDLHAKMGDWVAGCDICQEVCPYNTAPRPRPRPRPRHGQKNAHDNEGAVRDYAHGLNLLTLLRWTEDDRRRVFTRSALKRIKLNMLKRNALIAAGNFLRDTGDELLRTEVERIATDTLQSPMVQQTAREVLAALVRHDDDDIDRYID